MYYSGKYQLETKNLYLYLELYILKNIELMQEIIILRVYFRNFAKLKWWNGYLFKYIHAKK